MCNDHNNNKKRGINLEDKDAHNEDHKNWSRRNFMQTLGLVGGVGATVGGFSVSAMGAGNVLSFLNAAGIDDRILVLIRLQGGNDGLNTIIPLFDYGTYSDKRPSIKINQNQILNLSNEHGIPNTLEKLMPMWNDGQMKVVNTVGYPDQNLSHFTSSDIWSSADQNIETSEDKSGWLGRYILDQNPNFLDDLPETPAAIKISSASSIAYFNPDQIDLAVNFNTPDRLLSVAETGFVYDTENLPDDCYYGDQVGFLRSLMNLTFNYAPQISEAYSSSTNTVQYSNNELSRQLSIVARLIKGNLGTKLYMVTLGGFDTHENQNNNHPRLMRNLADGISEFYQDLANSNKDKDVLSMTFSEFGRRIEQNNDGTDHGSAGPVMLFGPGLNGNGILGANPDMDDVDNNGNLKHSVDFRSLYASILENWLCLDPVSVDLILGETYSRLDGLNLECLNVPTSDIPISQGITHGVRPDGMGGMLIEYELDRPGPINVSIYSILGQKVTTLVHEYQMKGKHSAIYTARYHGTSTAPFIYRIETEGKQYTGKFILRN